MQCSRSRGHEEEAGDVLQESRHWSITPLQESRGESKSEATSRTWLGIPDGIPVIPISSAEL